MVQRIKYGICQILAGRRQTISSNARLSHPDCGQPFTLEALNLCIYILVKGPVVVRHKVKMGPIIRQAEGVRSPREILYQKKHFLNLDWRKFPSIGRLHSCKHKFTSIHRGFPTLGKVLARFLQVSPIIPARSPDCTRNHHRQPTEPMQGCHQARITGWYRMLCDQRAGTARPTPNNLATHECRP